MERDITEYWSYAADSAAVNDVLIAQQKSGRALRKTGANPFTVAAGDDKKMITRPVLTGIVLDPDADITLVRVYALYPGTTTEVSGGTLFRWESGGTPVSFSAPIIAPAGADLALEVTRSASGTCRLTFTGFWSTHQREDVV